MKTAVLVLVIALVTSGCVSTPPVTTLAHGPSGSVAFQTLTFSGSLWSPFMPSVEEGRPAVIDGILTLPPGGGRAPAVILTHGCAGVGATETGWAAQLNQMGIATFVVDSFSGRNIQEVCTGRYTINTASVLVDVYRAQDLLATHPRIDPSRIALMGFSFGGRTAVWASQTRFQRRYGIEGRQFAAYLAFYPASCYITLADEAQTSGGPIRIFHGVADDWTPIEPCRRHVERVRRAGKDAVLYEYPDAHHSFDSPRLAAVQSWAQAISPRNCAFVERDGKIVDPATGRVPGTESPCFTRGIHIGYNAQAHRQAIEDVRSVLQRVFGLN
jgi:dienelactone hydrolase